MLASDLEAGRGSWSNIAQIVRQTFVSVYERLRAHSERIKMLEKEAVAERKRRKDEGERIAGMLQLEANAQSSQAAFKNLLDERDQRIHQLENDVKNLRAQLEDFATSLPKREELQKVFAKKVDVKTLETALSAFPDKDEVGLTLQELRAAFNLQLEELREQTKEDAHQLVVKASALKRRELDEEETREFEFMRNTITSEMLLGRWIWEGDRSGIVSWNETLNTSQLMFEMFTDGGVRLLKKGIYEVNLACFTERDTSTVQILVNNQLFVSSESPTMNSQQGALRGSKKLGLKGMCGWSVCEYLDLPQDAELTVRYRGEACRGFLSIKNIHCDFDGVE